MTCWTGLTDASRKRIIGLMILSIFFLGIASYLIYVFARHSNDFKVCVTSGTKQCTTGHTFGGISMGFTMIIHSFYAMICFYKIWSTIDENPSTLVTRLDIVFIWFYFGTHLGSLIFSCVDMLTNQDWNIYILCGNLIPVMIFAPWIICGACYGIILLIIATGNAVITPFKMIWKTYQIINQRKDENQVSWYWNVLTSNAKKDILICTAVAFGNLLLAVINVYILAYDTHIYKYVNSDIGLGGLYVSMIVGMIWILSMFYFIWQQLYYNYEELVFNWIYYLSSFGASHALYTALMCMDNPLNFQFNFGFIYVHFFIPTITTIIICGVIIFLLVQCFKCCHEKVTETRNIIKNREVGFVKGDLVSEVDTQ